VSEIYSQLDFEPHPLYESIIADLMLKDYSVIDHFFDTQTVTLLRDSLLNHFEEDRFKKAGIGNKTNQLVAAGIRGDYILWIDERIQTQIELVFFRQIYQFIEYLNRTCFLGILHHEFHYALYPPGTGYKRHLDTFQNDDKRKLSIAFYLNEPDWKASDGGALAMYINKKNGSEELITILPEAGRMVIFESQKIPHEVLLAQRNRLSITGWLKTN
jgi:SM-20-related protein